MKNKTLILVALAIIGLGIVNLNQLVNLQDQTNSIRQLTMRTQARGSVVLVEKLKLQELCIVDENGRTTTIFRPTDIILFGLDSPESITLFNDTNPPFILIADIDYSTVIDPGGMAFFYGLDGKYGLNLGATKNSVFLRMQHGKKEVVRFWLDDHGPMLGVFNRFNRDSQPAVNLFDK